MGHAMHGEPPVERYSRVVQLELGEKRLSGAFPRCLEFGVRPSPRMAFKIVVRELVLTGQITPETTLSGRWHA